MTVDSVETLVIHPGALGDVLQAVPAIAALGRLGNRLTFAGQPRLGELLKGSGVVLAAAPFDTFGLEALFVDTPVSDRLASRLERFRRVVSWFGAREAGYAHRLRALVPEALEVALGASSKRLIEPALTELAGALALAHAYIGSDSGVSHLAASVGTPSVILFPPETLRRWAPWGPAALPLGVGSEGEEP